MFIQIFELIVIFFIDSLNAIYKVEGVDLYHILIYSISLLQFRRRIFF